MDQAPDHEALNKELSAEALGLRGRLLTATKQLQTSVENANSLSAQLDEVRVTVREAEAGRRQAEGDLAVEREKLPPLYAKVAKLESDLRFVADVLGPVHDKVQSLRPE